MTFFRYPNVHYLGYHRKTQTLTVLYSDRSIYHWQINFCDGKLPTVCKISSQLFHVGPIFDVAVVPLRNNHNSPCVFFTGGSDETIRAWNLESLGMSSDIHKTNLLQSIPAPNYYSNELRKILYIGQGVDSLSEQPDSELILKAI